MALWSRIISFIDKLLTETCKLPLLKMTRKRREQRKQKPGWQREVELYGGLESLKSTFPKRVNDVINANKRIQSPQEAPVTVQDIEEIDGEL